jgi:hypothetical protein
MAEDAPATEAVKERAQQQTTESRGEAGGLLGRIARALGFVAGGDADTRERSRRTCCRAQGF